MTVTLDDLIETGKRAFELVTEAGGFFFPIVTFQLEGDDGIQVAQYDSGYDAYREVMLHIARQGRLSMVGSTADAYHIRSDECPPEVIEAYFDGKTTAKAEFDAGTPGAYEALSVVRNTLDASEGVFLPYERLPHSRKVVWIDVPVELREAPPFGRYVTAARAAIRLSLSPGTPTGIANEPV